MSGARDTGLCRGTLPAEIRFILDVLAGPPGTPPRPAADIDWRRFLDCVRHHRVAAQMTAALDPQVSMPEPARRELAEVRREVAARTLGLNGELARLTLALQAAGVEVLALKGPALAALLHGDPLRRAARDIDLLVRPAFQARALEILAALGYDRLSLDANAIELRHASRPFLIELHVRLADFDAMLPLAELRPFETAVSVEIAGVPVRTLCAEAAVVYAAHHGTRHLWTRLFWLADVAAATRADLDWSRIVALARRCGVARHLTVSLLLAEGLLGADWPAAVPRGTARAAGVRRMMAALPEVLSVPPMADHAAYRSLGPVRSLLLELGLYRRWRAWWATLQARATPTDTDRAEVRLPDGLDALYYAVRAVRVLRVALTRRAK